MSSRRLLASMYLTSIASVMLHAQTGVWKASPLPMPSGGSYSLIDFADSVNGWVFSNNGRYVLSSDGGGTWSAVRSIPDSLTVVRAKLYDGKTGIVVVQTGQASSLNVYLLRSRDGCASWDLLHLPARVFDAGAVSIACRQELGILSDSGTILRSNDLGATWDTLAPLAPVRAARIAIMRNRRVFLSSVLGGNPGDGFLITSADEGLSWDSVGGRADMGQSTSTVYSDDLACFGLYYGDDYIDQFLALYNAAKDSILTPCITGHSGYFLGSGVFYDDGTSFVIPAWNAALVKKDENPDDSLYVIQVGTPGLASGVYFYRLQAGRFVRTMKLVNLH